MHSTHTRPRKSYLLLFASILDTHTYTRIHVCIVHTGDNRVCVCSLNECVSPCLVVWVWEVLTCPSLPALPGLRRRPSTRSEPPRHSCCRSPPTWHHTARGCTRVWEGEGVGSYIAICWQGMLDRCAQHVSGQNIPHTYVRIYSVTHPPSPQSPSPVSPTLPHLSPPLPPQSPSPL